MKVVPFLDWGRWVANCPNPACTNAMGLEPGQARFVCALTNRDGSLNPHGVGVCGTSADVEWPEDAAAVAAAFAGTPERAQSWHPGDDVP